MKKSNKYVPTLLMLGILTAACGGKQTSKIVDVVYDSIEAEHALPGSSEILSKIKQQADLVTTEVTIRKIAIYDSSKSEKFEWRSPSTWKYGDRKCIIPVEVHIKYGYDLSQMTVDDIKLTDDSTAIIINLPKAKIIDAGYNAEIPKGSVTSMSTGLRSDIGHQMEEEIRHAGYESVLKEDLTGVFGQDIERNAKSVFESLLKSLGWQNVTIVTRKN